MHIADCGCVLHNIATGLISDLREKPVDRIIVTGCLLYTLQLQKNYISIQYTIYNMLHMFNSIKWTLAWLVACSQVHAALWTYSNIPVLCSYPNQLHQNISKVRCTSMYESMHDYDLLLAWDWECTKRSAPVFQCSSPEDFPVHSFVNIIASLLSNTSKNIHQMWFETWMSDQTFLVLVRFKFSQNIKMLLNTVTLEGAHAHGSHENTTNSNSTEEEKADSVHLDT